MEHAYLRDMSEHGALSRGIMLLSMAPFPAVSCGLGRADVARHRCAMMYLTRALCCLAWALRAQVSCKRVIS
jgi:hypothetical protein